MTKPHMKAIRGMKDILPADSPAWQHLEHTLRTLCHQYGYNEIRMPIVEPTQLFKRTVGDATDIVEKEMYTFEDRNGDSLSLRPEGTASCVRAGIESGLLYNQRQKLWYMGPMFRHERPQKGRYRQFCQFGLEAFGVSTSDIEAEHLLFCSNAWKLLGIEDVTLELNSLGSKACQAAYREALVDYFSAHKNELDEDSQRRLHTNPLRILDSKNPVMQTIKTNAPALSDYWDSESIAHIENLKTYLDALNIPYTINPHLVRGLDYYQHSIYEWVTHSLGAQGTICAGGRYDGLVEQLGGHPTAATGFAMGLERILELMDTPTDVHKTDIYFVVEGDNIEAMSNALTLCQHLRAQLPQIKLVLNTGAGSLKSQFKRANASDADIAIVLGSQELSEQTVTVKWLKKDGLQDNIPQNQLIAYLNQECLDGF